MLQIVLIYSGWEWMRICFGACNLTSIGQPESSRRARPTSRRRRNFEAKYYFQFNSIYSRSNLNSSVNFKSYLVIGNLTMIKTNCYNVSHTQRPLIIGLSFVKNVSTNCTLKPILPGNFLRSEIGRF